MCGIFGLVSSSAVNKKDLRILAKHAEQRGRDSSGLIIYSSQQYKIYRANSNIGHLLPRAKYENASVVMGHSRLITNGLDDNQPIYRDGVCVLHNGIIVNEKEIWDELTLDKKQKIDTEVIAGIALDHLEQGGTVESLASAVLERCSGVVVCALALPRLGKLLLFSNNGSLYAGYKDKVTAFSSEKYPLEVAGFTKVQKIKEVLTLEIPTSLVDIGCEQIGERTVNLIPQLGNINSEERLLECPSHTLKRCSKCILPETMPFISFDDKGVCNFCLSYKPRNAQRPVDELFDLIEPYRRKHSSDCIVPFSGGRDSCFGLHFIVNELNMKPVTYTYDWGMVTDLGRRNISRMCAALGVENIIIAADINRKRQNITKNLKAWLKSPHLGMLSILTAGDKHFFHHVETVKKQTGIALNLWGINPLEVTHFKAGFLGVPPDFEEERVYTHGLMKQLRYQSLRLKAMVKSPGYFNSSLWDTLSGEYYRSFTEKSDYYHIFDYWRWDENLINKTLDDYRWELAPDTSTTWRIGDGTAGFYNYVYYLVAGFTEHDTFRSNQIREGDLTRDDALMLVKEENLPRYPNIKWYLDALNLDYEHVIKTVNNIPKLYA